MSKPISRKDAFLRRQFADPQPEPGCKDPEREKRRIRREAKKKRNKHFRTLGKKEIRDQEKG